MTKSETISIPARKTMGGISAATPGNRANLREIRHITRIETFAFLLFVSTVAVSGSEKTIVRLRDFTQAEVKSGGFSLPVETRIHITAFGSGGERRLGYSGSELYAYGWIINADSRAEVWRMSRNNTLKDGRERKFDGDITLPKGDYEVYYTAYAYRGGSTFTNFNINVDPRDHGGSDRRKRRHGFIDWFVDLFTEDIEK